MKKATLKKLSAATALAVPAAAMVGTAVAGTGGTEFGGIVTQLTDWLEGGLGQVLALGALAVGLGIGIVQQSIMSVVVGIAMAIAVFYGPGVLTGIVTTGLPW
ncbi:MAG TPA: TraA family conjugative transfer protein [Salinibacter sp.]|nr:TraA family conjugative transfer protein [Salinibacter sp.]